MTLFPRLGVAGISTPWPFRYPQPVKMSISIASSPRLSGTGMTSLNRVSRFTGTDRNGPERTETDRNGPKRTFVDTETDFLGTETDFSGYRN